MGNIEYRLTILIIIAHQTHFNAATITYQMVYFVNFQAYFLKNLVSVIGKEGLLAYKCWNLSMLLVALLGRSLFFTCAICSNFSAGICINAMSSISLLVVNLPDSEYSL